jgi:hypothetical protein
VALLVAALGSQAATGSSGAEVEAPSDPWRAYQEGDFEKARVSFRSFAETPRLDEAKVGLLLLAWTEVRSTDLAQRLAALAPAREAPFVLAVASLLGTATTPPDPSAAGLAASLCADNPRDLSCIYDELRVAGVGSPRRCVAGCSGRQRAPLGMTHGGRIPVVMASVNGRAPAAFVLDTASDVNAVSPEFASRLDLSLDWSSTGMARSLTGLRQPYPYGVADRVQIGGVTLADVPFAVLSGIDSAGYGDGVAGFLNPSLLFGDRAISIDLRDFQLVVDDSGVAADDAVVLPLLRSLQKPAVMTSIGGGPERPMLLDTGTYATTVTGARMDLTGRYRVREAADVGRDGLGGEWSAGKVAGRWIARAGGLRWALEEPLFEIGAPRSGMAVQLGGWGRIGVDALLGRTLVLDAGSRTLAISKRARFPTLPPRARRTMAFDGTVFSESFTMTEEYVSQSAGTLLMLYSPTWRNGHQRFFLRMPHTWRNLYRWGFPLSVGDCEELTDILRTDFNSCRTLLAPFVDLELEEVRAAEVHIRDDPTRDGLCVDQLSLGLLDGRATRLEESLCFANPWLVERASLTDAATGKVVLGFSEVGARAPTRRAGARSGR